MEPFQEVGSERNRYCVENIIAGLERFSSRNRNPYDFFNLHFIRQAVSGDGFLHLKRSILKECSFLECDCQEDYSTCFRYRHYGLFIFFKKEFFNRNRRGFPSGNKCPYRIVNAQKSVRGLERGVKEPRIEKNGLFCPAVENRKSDRGRARIYAEDNHARKPVLA